MARSAVLPLLSHRRREDPKREFMRRGINQHTLEKICQRQPVRALKLAKTLQVLQELAIIT
jgi:hypothetical protein